MRVFVAGGLKTPVLLDTTEATAILIMNDDGQPNVIYQLLPNGTSWIRYTKGEDANFNDVAKELGLV